jgi:hypothetical protein
LRNSAPFRDWVLPTALDRVRRKKAEYTAWLNILPDSLQDSATAEALRAICELDLTELQAIVPPRGFGRD